jgi:protein-S-isoprenylcysteine O-methyltransferase Ste14
MRDPMYDRDQMKINFGSKIMTALVATVPGFGISAVVTLAMHRNLHSYLRYIGLLMIISAAIVGTWAYQRYVAGRHSPEEGDTR